MPTIRFLKKKKRLVDLPTGGHTSSIGDGLLSHSPWAKATNFICK
jgi:hypothetical protein